MSQDATLGHKTIEKCQAVMNISQDGGQLEGSDRSYDWTEAQMETGKALFFDLVKVMRVVVLKQGTFGNGVWRQTGSSQLGGATGI